MKDYEQKMTPELVRLVQVLGPRMCDVGGRFTEKTIDAVLSEWQLGASIDDDAWHALRIAAIEVLQSLTFSVGGSDFWVGADNVYISREELSSTRMRWMRTEEAYEYLTALGLLKKGMGEEERVEVISKHFFFPSEAIGPVEFDPQD